MIIVGDIGNTEVKICFFYNGLKKKYLFKTDSLNKKIIRNKFNFLRKKIYLKNAIISSVVPKTFSQIKKIFYNLYKVNCVELKKLNLTRLINIKVNKKEIGSDRLANAISVMNKKKICGILNETLFYNDLKFLVIGIGINIVSSPNLRNYPTTNLNEETNRKVSKTKLINKIIKAFDKK